MAGGFCNVRSKRKTEINFNHHSPQAVDKYTTSDELDFAKCKDKKTVDSVEVP